MKKLLILTMVCAFVFTMSAMVFAAEPADKTTATLALKAEVKQLVDELNGLRDQHKALHEQVLVKRDSIKSLFAGAKDAKAKDKLVAAKTFKEQIKAINTEIQSLKDIKLQLWVEIKNARTNKDFEALKADLTQVIDYKKQIISKANDKLGTLDQIINTLQ